jgi:hypothetical protein
MKTKQSAMKLSQIRRRIELCLKKMNLVYNHHLANSTFIIMTLFAIANYH